MTDHPKSKPASYPKTNDNIASQRVDGTIDTAMADQAMTDRTKTDPAIVDQATMDSSDPNGSRQGSYDTGYFDTLYGDNDDPWQYQTRWYEQRKRHISLALLPKAHYDHAIELGCGNGVFSERLATRCGSLISIDGHVQAVQLATARLCDLSHVRVVQGIIPDDLYTLDKRTHLKPNAAVSKQQPTVDSASSLRPSSKADGQVSAPYDNDDSGQDDGAHYDLIVVSEILYYLSLENLQRVIAWIKAHLRAGGTLLCCHWRYPIEGFALTGEQVHQLLDDALGAPSLDVASSSAHHTRLSADDTDADNKSMIYTHQSSLVDTDFLLDIWQYTPRSVAMREDLVG